MNIIANTYRIMEHMHRVGETDYYRAINLHTQTPVTLRTINIAEVGAVGVGIEHLAAEKLRRKIENEKKLIHQLKQLNVLDLLDIGFEHPFYYHVYPAFDFENLDMRIQKAGQLPLPFALSVILSMARTLTALHQHQIIHCDVSAENILLIEDQPRLIEFTIANYEQNPEAVPGNPPYMSPESFQGSAPAIERDIWALGVTLYYALCGHLPWEPETTYPDRARNMQVLITRIIYQDYQPIRQPQLPPRLVTLVDNMLSKDPVRRISPMARVADELQAIITELA